MSSRSRGCCLAFVAGSSSSFDRLEPRQMLSGEHLRFDLAAQAGTNAVVAADFDRNGIMDLAAANADGGSISVILSKEGKFQNTDNYPTGGTPYEIGLFDFNRDTFPDIITLDRQNAKIITLQNDGDGTFGSGPEIQLPAGAHSVRVGDFNHDESMDIAVLMPDENAVRIYLIGEGDESGPPVLGEYASYGVGNGASFLEMGDVNADGVLDLVTANTSDDTVTVLTGVAGTPSAADWLHDVFARLIHREPNSGELEQECEAFVRLHAARKIVILTSGCEFVSAPPCFESSLRICVRASTCARVFSGTTVPLERNTVRNKKSNAGAASRATIVAVRQQLAGT